MKSGENMNIAQIIQNGKHGEVFENDIDSSMIEVNVSNHGKKSIVWLYPPDNDFEYLSGQDATLDSNVIEANWNKTSDEGKYINKERCVISKRWFWCNKDESEALKDACFETIEMVEKMGFDVKILEPELESSDELIFILVEIRKNNKRRYTLSFHIDKYTRELSSTVFSTHSILSEPFMKHKLRLNSLRSLECDNNFVEPITFLQKFKLQLLFTS